jgi:hypothetical protein
MQSFKFSGHETFICKHFWPKKGVDFLLNGYSFNDDDAVVKLGVGKNMVTSIRFWLKALALIDENENLTDLSKIIFSDGGYDPYIEDIGTIWLLHYNLISQNYASLYNLIFNHFLKGRTDFTKDNLRNYLKRVTDAEKVNLFNEKTIQQDINVFIRNYLVPKKGPIKQNIEEEFSCLFIDLNLIESYQRRNQDSKIEEYLLMERNKKPTLPLEIFLFAVLSSNGNGSNISINELHSGNNSVGNVFLLNKDGIYEKIEGLSTKYKAITYSQAAGNFVLHINQQLEPIQLVKAYYEK